MAPPGQQCDVGKSILGLKPKPQIPSLALPPANFATLAKGGLFYMIVCVLCARLLQSCLTLYDPMDYSPPGSSVRGILQARMLEWSALPFSRGSS